MMPAASRSPATPKEISMAPTRRDIVKLGAALGLGPIMPTGAERVAAMQVLNQPLSDDPRHEPGTFAVRADDLIGNVTDHWWKNIARTRRRSTARQSAPSSTWSRS
jgi:hypothetical protein